MEFVFKKKGDAGAAIAQITGLKIPGLQVGK
jgi:hypothetical protein